MKYLFRAVFLSVFCLWSAAGTFAASATIDRIWLEHNISQDGQTGLRIHLTFTVWDMQGQQGEAVAYIESPKGVGVKDLNRRYYTTDGNVCTSEHFTPSYPGTEYSDFTLFIPNEELHLLPGSHTYYCQVCLFDAQGNDIAYSDYAEFEGTGTEATPAADRAAQAHSRLPEHFEIYLENRTDLPGSTKNHCPIRVWGGDGPDGPYCCAAFAGSIEPFFVWNGTMSISGDDFVFKNRGDYASTFTLRRDLTAATYHGGGSLSPLESYGPPMSRDSWMEASIAWGQANLNAYQALSNSSSAYESDSQHDEDSESSSRRSSTPTYRDHIIYITNYTGEDIRQWCDQCQEWGLPHIHGRQRSN